MVHGKERRGSKSRSDEVALALCIHKHLVNESYVSVDVLYTIRHVASFFKDGGSLYSYFNVILFIYPN